MDTTINDGGEAMRANLRAQEVQRRYEVRAKLRDKIALTLLNNPLSLMQQNIEKLTDWILNVFVSELQTPSHVSMDQIKTVFGVTPSDQVYKLIAFYESHTDKRATDL